MKQTPYITTSTLFNLCKVFTKHIIQDTLENHYNTIGGSEICNFAFADHNNLMWGFIDEQKMITDS